MLYGDVQRYFYWMNIPDEKLAQLGSTSEDYNQHTFDYCPICGLLRWRGSKQGEKFQVTIKEKEVSGPFNEDRECEVCSEITQRNPEVFMWVLACIRMARKIHMKEDNQQHIQEGNMTKTDLTEEKVNGQK